MGKLILIVEDEVDQREGLSDLLTDVGYRVATAATGKEAMKLVATERPALVLSDLMLRDMDGRNLLARMRQEFPEPPPVIFITGAHPSVTGDISSEVFLKPFDINRLLTLVSRYCGEQPSTIFDSATQ